MNDDPTRKLSEAEEAALRALGEDVAPSPELEGRVVAALKQRGDIRASGGWVMKSTRALVAAVVAGIVFVAGFAVGNQGQAQSPATTEAPVVATTPAGQQYMLLMYTRAPQPGAERPPSSGKSLQEIIAEYRDWAHAREREGRLVSAEKLSGKTRVVTTKADGVEVASTAASDRVLGGYFLITAPSLADALELAESHPHLKYGGEVEVRPIESTR